MYLCVCVCVCVFVCVCVCVCVLHTSIVFKIDCSSLNLCFAFEVLCLYSSYFCSSVDPVCLCLDEWRCLWGCVWRCVCICIVHTFALV